MSVIKWFRDDEVGKVASSLMAMRIYDRIRERYIADNPLVPAPERWNDTPEQFQESFQAACLEELDYLAQQMSKEFTLVPKDQD